jgi:16S rRNA (guanine527-N7)-methyltransferase
MPTLSLADLQTIYPEITAKNVQSLTQLVEIFLEKNQYINLSAIRDEKNVWEKHIYDSLAAAKYIRELQPKKIVDMGTGGGFPTIPLSICFEEKQFYPVDSVQKKLKAVEEFAEKLELKNIFPLWGRAEELARDKKLREKFPLVVTRAFAKFSPLLEMTMPFLKVKGVLLAYRGPENNGMEDELLIDYFGGLLEEKFCYMLPSGEKRELWKIIKLEETEKQFPRRAGTPKKEPIEAKR